MSLFGSRTAWALVAAGAVALVVTPISNAAHAGSLPKDHGFASTMPGETAQFSCSGMVTCLSSTATSAGGRAFAGQASEAVLGVISGEALGMTGVGVRGTQAGVGSGVAGESVDGTGVFGFHTGSTTAEPGVSGLTSSQATGANGVFGKVLAATPGSYSAGVKGQITAAGFNGFGVFGEHTGAGIGVYGEALNGFGVSGFSPNNWAGYFHGAMRVVGNLQKNSGSFTIDHPLDPGNKYLSHSFVESPDMKNVYDGVVTTNSKGFATVKLPRYFQALNRSFRYQLTSLSGLQDVAVAKKIHNNRFTIQSEKPFAEVSWQVTGIRKDRWANAHRIKVEEPKKASERGKYLNPELYGESATKSVVVLPGMKTAVTKR